MWRDWVIFAVLALMALGIPIGVILYRAAHDSED
jgi:hypothetical protein